jgi:hypothetical protein
MIQLTVTGWVKGCNTVAAIKVLREKAPMPLNEALDLVNRVLNNERVIVPVSATVNAHALAESLEDVGLVLNIDDDSKT